MPICNGKSLSLTFFLIASIKHCSKSASISSGDTVFASVVSFVVLPVVVALSVGAPSVVVVMVVVVVLSDCSVDDSRLSVSVMQC